MSGIPKPLRAGMAGCKVTKLNLRIGKFAPEEDIDIELDTRWRRIDVNKKPVGLECDLRINGNEGKALSVEMTLHATFDIPKEASFEEAENFLAKEAPTRVIDAARPHIEAITSTTPFGPLEIPPMFMEIDPEGWR